MVSKPHILMLGHGGTIAMTQSDKGLIPTKSAEDILSMVPLIGDKAEVTLIQLDNVDSTNIGPSHWSKLIMEIAKHVNDYNGILVTHGTDTMAYTATAVSFGLGRALQIPIVFTGSQLPLASFQTDARSNLERAVNAIIRASQLEIAEVMVVFNDVVLRGNRSIKTSEARFDAFDSPAFPHLGDITATGISFSPQAFKRVGDRELKVEPRFDNSIASIEMVPGLKPSLLRAIVRSGECHGLLLKSLGAGNVPNLDEQSVLPVIEDAVSMKIPVLLSTKFVGGSVESGHYEVGRAAIDAGAIPTGDLTDVAAQVKFMWALAQGKADKDELHDFINQDIVGEISVRQ